MRKDLIKLHFIVLLWGFTGVLGALIQLSAIYIVFYRLLIATTGVIIWMAYTKMSFKIMSRDLMLIIGTGIIIAFHWITFFHAIKVSNISVALACMSAVSVFVALLEPLFFKRRIILYELFFALLTVAGLYLIFRFEPGYRTGILFSITSAFLAALFTVINGIYIKKHSSDIITLYEMIGGLAAISIYIFLTDGIIIKQFYIDLYSFFWLLILGTICTSYAFMESVKIMKKLTPFTVAITVNLEPVYAIILAVLIFGDKEFMSLGFYIGTSIILTTIFANSWLKSRKKQKLQ